MPGRFPIRARVLFFTGLFTLALAALITSPLAASESSSPNFKNSRSALSTGGRRQTGTGLTNQQSVGPLGRTSQTGTGFAARGGLMAIIAQPGKITGLFASTGTAPGTIDLQWTAPGNDGYAGGTSAGAYVIKYSTTAGFSPAQSETLFNAAASVAASVPTPATQGSRENLTLTGLIPNATYYFAFKARERDGIPGVLSAGVTAYATTDIPAGCGSALNVKKDNTRDYTTIQAAVAASPTSLASNACVVIRDTQTYSEQVTVQGITTNGFTFKIMADPTFVSSAPVVTPPVLSTAAFFVLNDSVTIQNVLVITTNAVAYGISASSSQVTISSVNIDSGGNIWTAGIRLLNGSAVSNSSVTVQNAHGLWATGSMNAVTSSTMSANNSDKYALFLNGASSNTVTRSRVSNPLGTATRLDSGAGYNTISQSTITSNAAGYVALDITASSSNTFLNSYVQGSTAALISGSTGTIINSSVLVATNTIGSALALQAGAVNLTVASSTLRSLSQGRGLALNPDNSGVVSLGSVTFTGAARGIEISTQAQGFTLSVDSITFRDLATGATAVHFLGGTFVSTFTLANFEDTSVGANVNAALLDPASRITMRSSKGSRWGSWYENDPQSLVDWADGLPPGSPSILAVYQSSITVTFTTVDSQGYKVEASTRSDFTPVFASSTTTNPALGSLSPQNLDPNTTYYLRVGALYGANYSYNPTTLSTATLAKQVQGAQVFAVNLTSITINWVPLPTAAQEGSSNSAQGYLLQVSSRADFAPLWTSSRTPNVALSTLAAFNLYGGTTYYFRVGALNHNDAANYGVTVSTLLPIQLGVELTTHSLSLPGLTNMNATIVISTSIIATNTGNVNETYRLRATTVTGGSPWQISASAGVDRYVLWSVLNNTQPAVGDFDTEDKLDDPETQSTGSIFTMGGETGVAVPPGQTRTLWFKLGTPLATSTNAAQDIEIKARAVASP